MKSAVSVISTLLVVIWIQGSILAQSDTKEFEAANSEPSDSQLSEPGDEFAPSRVMALVGGEPIFAGDILFEVCLLYTSPSPRDQRGSRMPSSA